MKPNHIAVIDIGKTNAKVALVDLNDLSEIAVATRPNKVLAGPPWPHFDVDAHWEFLLDALKNFHAQHRVDAISITTHGACVALLDISGNLAAPILDYEHYGPENIAIEYDEIRPSFSETGSPRLPFGLNVGAQLYWMLGQDIGLLDRTHCIVTYPQYWGHRLTGVAATDITSLGCHTDLWNPYQNQFSSLVKSLAIQNKIAPTCLPSTVLGRILPVIANRTGLSVDTLVYSGIHDSNASLLPHLKNNEPPFSVVSTGTWVISMSIGGKQPELDPADDTLINVNAFGDPVMSARFMGGREYEMVVGDFTVEPSASEIKEVLKEAIMLLPAVVPDAGPFMGMQSVWKSPEPNLGSGQRAAAVGFYLSLVTARSLELIGHEGPIIIEGPFARNRCFLMMLSVAAGCEVKAMDSATGTSAGAALLASFDIKAKWSFNEKINIVPTQFFDLMERYAKQWRYEVLE
jgi:sugar (pentulose or hexulose) kinase